MNDETPVLRISRFAIFICLLVIMAYPIFWSIMSSVKTNAELVANPFSIPREPQIDNIVELWVEGDFIRYFRNTLIISLVTVIGVVTMSTMAGYVFSQRATGAYKFLFLLFLFGLMVPREVVIVPVFRIIASLGLRNTLGGVILVYMAGTSFGIVLMRTYFLSVPTELREAALIDGCSEFGVFFRIYVPLAAPAMVTVSIFAFFFSWNDLLWPLILIQQPEWFTLVQGVLRYQDEFTIDWSKRSAGLVFSILPPLIFYLIFNRGIQSGLTAGAIKM
ncbi:MAG: carbohydrate ABC transporter permease [Chloroflexi bacterium]|nr:carbohydrate ABC transporter permease [Chloroflexota bacterium]